MIGRRFGSRRGSAILELGLVMGAFLFMVVGTLDIGRVLYLHQALTERARSAARWGASHTYNETNLRNVVLYNSPTAPEGGRPIFGLGTENVGVSRINGLNGVPAVLTVSITGWSYRFLSPYIAGTAISPDIITSMTMENP